MAASSLPVLIDYGTGPAYHKLGGRVVYSIEDLGAWVKLGSVTSTTDPRGGQVLPAKRHVFTAVPPAGRAFR